MVSYAGVVGQLPAGLVEPLSPQPAVVDLGPGVAAGVDDALPQQHLRQPMPGPHQIAPDILPGPHQVPGRLLLHTRHHHLDELINQQQPSQQLRVPGVGLHPIPVRPLQLRRRPHRAPHPMLDQVPVQAVAGRAGLIADMHRPGQTRHPAMTCRPDPGSACAATPPRSHPSNACPVTDLACTSNPTNVRSLLTEASRNLWLYRTSRKPARQPTTTCERGLSLLIPSNPTRDFTE